MRMRARAAWQSSFHARPPVLSDRDDRSGAAREDGGVAATCIVGAVHCPAGHRDAMSREGGGGHGADLLTLGDLAAQVWED
jgi:hypothetical protein